MIVLDNSVLSAFQRLKALHLLHQLYGLVIIPSHVREEFKRKWTCTTLPAWLRVEDLGNARAKKARQLKLGLGEAQSILLAEREGTLLAIDEQQARKIAKDKKIPVIGSIGILRMVYEYCPIERKKTLKKLVGKLREDLYLREQLIKWTLKVKKARMQHLDILRTTKVVGLLRVLALRY